MSYELTRRDFLSACSVLAASLTACTGPGYGLRAAASLLTDPAFEDYRAPLRALIETVLPERFPISTDEVERRFLQMFPLEEESRFLGLQKALVYFNDLHLAPYIAEPMIAAERVALDVPERLSEREFDALCEAKASKDGQPIGPFFYFHGKETHFASLPRDSRAIWLEFWSESQFTVKREFARSVRNLICIAAYSSDRVWPAIGYDGPLVKR